MAGGYPRAVRGLDTAETRDVDLQVQSEHVDPVTRKVGSLGAEKECKEYKISYNTVQLGLPWGPPLAGARMDPVMFGSVFFFMLFVL